MLENNHQYEFVFCWNKYVTIMIIGLTFIIYLLLRYWVHIMSPQYRKKISVSVDRYWFSFCSIRSLYLPWIPFFLYVQFCHLILLFHLSWRVYFINFVYMRAVWSYFWSNSVQQYDRTVSIKMYGFCSHQHCSVTRMHNHNDAEFCRL